MYAFCSADCKQMAFNNVELQIHSVISFNKDMQIIYEAPEPGDDKTIVIIDSSGSMGAKESEMKLIVSALKCMSNTRGMWNLPKAKGPTALLDTVDKTVERNISGVKKIIIVSDGDDNSSTKDKVINAIAEGGAPEFCCLPSLPLQFSQWLGNQSQESSSLVDIQNEYQTYVTEALDKRREAIVTHFNHIGVELFVVGVGKEVKDFIKKCSSKGRNINTALIEVGNTAKEIGAVMSTVIKRSRANAVSVPKETVTTDTADAISDIDVSKVAAEAVHTTSHSERKTNKTLLNDGPLFDPDRQLEYIRFIVKHVASKNNLSPSSIEAIIMWFRSMVEAQDGAPVAGALIGGQLFPKDKKGRRHGPVFDVPNDDTRPSVWTNALSSILKFLSREPNWIADKIEGLHGSFADDFVSKRVGPVFAEVGKPESFMAVTKKDLPQAERVLYYKFKKDTYLHYVANHRMRGIADYVPLALKTLTVVYGGNSGAKSYGGPIIEENVDMVLDALDTTVDTPDHGETEVMSEATSESGESSASTTETSENVHETNVLKRKIEVLEKANEQLKKKLSALRNVLESE